MMKTTKTFLISLCIFEVIFLGNTVGLAAGTYNGSANVSVKSGNLRPGNNSATAYCYACVDGNRFTNRNVNSSVSGRGYIYYYDPAVGRYREYNFSRSSSIYKSGTKCTIVSKSGADLTSKYQDVYAMSIHCVFNLQCNVCGSSVRRTVNGYE